MKGWYAALLKGIALTLAALFLLAMSPGVFRVGCRRTRESECLVNLKAWFTAQLAFRSVRGRFEFDSELIGFSPEYSNRYLYAWSPFGRFAKRRESARGASGIRADQDRYEPVPLYAIPTIVSGGLKVGVTPTIATAVCVGNLDKDPVMDVWSISTEPRTLADGTAIPAGVPHHENQDRDD